MLVFIIPFHNVEKYLSECLLTLTHQEKKDWRAILVDDCSTDNSVALIPRDTRFSLIKNQKRLTALPNIHNAIITGNLNDEDVICILDGDDKLIMPNVISIIEDMYTNSDTLLTYGQYITSQGLRGHCRAYNPISFQQLRRGQYMASHLRTFKYKLYKELLAQDPELHCYKDSNGAMFKMAYDVAIMTPMLEIAGLSRIRFNPVPVYYYRIHPNNDHLVNRTLQNSIAFEIYRKPKFKQAF